MNFFEYKGFTIYPDPRFTPEFGRWTINLSIRRRDGIKAFSSSCFFSTRGEAVFHCINFGKKIIDGEIEGCTIDDMV